MAGTFKTIQIGNLLNYYENPRHAIGSSEEDTLRKLFEAVGTQYMLNLAEDVQKNGLLGNQQIVVVYSEEKQKYVVYEGNRRIAAIKLLLNPDQFAFIDPASMARAKRLGQKGNIPTHVNCYVTNEAEAFFIMGRLHSGEDKGRGTKQWTAREKEAFKSRQSAQKKASYLIDLYCKQYFDGFDITTILPFTTIERIFNNREIKKKIGLDTTNETTFSKTRMQLIIDASKWVVQEANSSGMSVTRLFNKARTIEDKLIPWLEVYLQGVNLDDSDVDDQSTEAVGYSTDEENTQGTSNDENEDASGGSDDVPETRSGDDNAAESNTGTSAGGSRNLPYFFQGINYSNLDPNDPYSHGVSAVCRELQLFSDGKYVERFPIASTFLIRSIIEQSIVYYSKKHTVQGQQKLIWDNIKNLSKLSKIIDNYKHNLPNYIQDSTIRQYFKLLFDNYEENVDPLNWVVHRPAEFQLDPNTLIGLPRKGLLTVVNYFLS